MPKYWGEHYFANGSFPEVGQKQKTEKKEEEKRPKVGDNNGQATHGARMAHASRPGPKYLFFYIFLLFRSKYECP